MVDTRILTLFKDFANAMVMKSVYYNSCECSLRLNICLCFLPCIVLLLFLQWLTYILMFSTTQRFVKFVGFVKFVNDLDIARSSIVNRYWKSKSWIAAQCAYESWISEIHWWDTEGNPNIVLRTLLISVCEQFVLKWLRMLCW